MNPYKEEQDAKRKDSLEARCLALHKSRKKVEAVKLYRAATVIALVVVAFLAAWSLA